MKSWTIFLALSITFPLLFSCTDENDPGFDDTLAGSISYEYNNANGNMYINGNVVNYELSAACSFRKIDNVHVQLFYGIRYISDKTGSYRFKIDDIKVFGKPYDVYFDYYSESEDNQFSHNEENFNILSAKLEGSLYNERANIIYTSPLNTRDWSPPYFTGDLKITIVLENGDEYVFEITSMS